MITYYNKIALYIVYTFNCTTAVLNYVHIIINIIA